MHLQLIEKKQETPDVVTFYFRPDMPLIWKPGQFLRYKLPNPAPDERGINRFFSIASSPYEDRVQLTTRFVPEKGSSFKKDLQKLEVGQSIEVTGPSGHFSMDELQNHYVFIAGGIGITPFRAILMDLESQNLPLNVTLLYANRNKEAIFKNELEELAKKHPEFKIFYIIDGEPTNDEKITDNIRVLPGKVDANLIQTLVPDAKSDIFYISGPEPMVLALEKVVWDLGVPKENTKRDYFPGYEQF